MFAAMTVERKITVGMADIKTISYECNHCGARVTFPLGYANDPRTDCYVCGKPWRTAPRNSAPGYSVEPSAWLQLLQAADAIRKLEKEAGFRIVFEFDEPSTR